MQVRGVHTQAIGSTPLLTGGSVAKGGHLVGADALAEALDGANTGVTDEEELEAAEDGSGDEDGTSEVKGDAVAEEPKVEFTDSVGVGETVDDIMEETTAEADNV